MERRVNVFVSLLHTEPKICVYEYIRLFTFVSRIEYTSLAILLSHLTCLFEKILFFVLLSRLLIEKSGYKL